MKILSCTQLFTMTLSESYSNPLYNIPVLLDRAKALRFTSTTCTCTSSKFSLVPIYESLGPSSSLSFIHQRNIKCILTEYHVHYEVVTNWVPYILGRVTN